MLNKTIYEHTTILFIIIFIYTMKEFIYRYYNYMNIVCTNVYYTSINVLMYEWGTL